MLIAMENISFNRESPSLACSSFDRILFSQYSKIMWPKEYKDYPKDKPLIQNQVSPGHGIIGCEMHDLNGWGQNYHIEKPVEPGLFRSLFVTKSEDDKS